MNKSVRGEKAGLPLPSNVEGISSNILLILTAKNTTPMNSPKNHVEETTKVSLTFDDIKNISKDISCINKEIKAVLRDYNFEYQSFNPKPLPLSEEGFRELRSRLIELKEGNLISLNPSEVFKLIRTSNEFLAFKQELGNFIAQLKMEVRTPEEEVEMTKGTPALEKWIPKLCSLYPR